MSYKRTLLACYIGYITQAIVNNFSPLMFVLFHERFGISPALLGQLVLINFLVQLATDAASTRVLRVLGLRKTVVLAHLFGGGGMMLLGILPSLFESYAAIVFATVFCSIGGGLIEVVVSPIVDALPGDAKASSMSLLHSFYCWGQLAVVLFSTVALSLIGESLWWILPMLWGLIPLANAMLFARVPLLPIDDEHHPVKISSLLRSPFFLVSMALMLCSGAAELSISQWASYFAEVGLGIPKVAGDLLGPCGFALLMALGRTVYGTKGAKIPLLPALTACSALTVLCYAIASLAQSPILSLCGVAFAGLGVSLMWPGVVSYTSSRIATKNSLMFALLALSGDLGCALGPWMTGLVSDYTSSIKTGLLCTIVFPTVMTAILLVSGKKKKNK